MANAFVIALRNEIAALEKELAGDPRFKKLKRLADALDAYLEDDDNEGITAAHDQSDQQIGRALPQGRAQMDKNAQILDIASEIITSRGGNTPIPTREILDEVVRRGIEVHGREPRNTLSAIISYSRRFKAHGRSGWTVRDDDDGEGDTEATDDPNLPGRTSAASAEHRSTTGGTRAEPKSGPGGGA